jgi:hypothetical protein
MFSSWKQLINKLEIMYTCVCIAFKKSEFIIPYFRKIVLYLDLQINILFYYISSSKK